MESHFPQTPWRFLGWAAMLKSVAEGSDNPCATAGVAARSVRDGSPEHAVPKVGRVTGCRLILVGQTSMPANDRALLQRFSREAFERSSDPERLSLELEQILLPRLMAASDRLQEAHAIVEDLRAAGHVLWSWDESDDFSSWGDDYANPPLRTRFLVEMRWPADDDTPTDPVEVAITFGLWPRGHR